MKFNFHTHSLFSDGQNTIEEMIDCAIGQNFDILGFSDHSPAPFPSKWNMKYEQLFEYLRLLDEAKIKYSKKITVLKSLEIDHFPKINNIQYFKSFGLDYTIGSVHYLGSYPDGKLFNIDKSPDEFIRGLNIIFNNDIFEFVSAYYQEVIKMVINDQPDIIAHLNLIEKFNKQLKIINTNEIWYKDLIFTTLTVIRQSDSVLEINARSWYLNFTDDFMPSLWILQQAKKLGIPVTISGDIHTPPEFGLYWKEALDFAKAAGYQEITYFLQDGRREILKI